MNTVPMKNCCPKCAAPLADDAPQGLCPKCLLAAAVAPSEAGPTTAETPAVPSLETVQAAFPQLEVLEQIGVGGMGVVFKVRQPRLDRFGALKLLSPALAAAPAFAERFNREARVLARLNHPGIVSVYDFGQEEGFFFLLMEYVDGVNLRQAMRAGRFTPQQALALVPRICEALQFAHDEGILHRDVKPENILLDTKGRVKIADFGIAKLMDEPRPVTKLTATGAAIGTPNYMAPEQIEHPEDVDQRADIYSLGVVFYEMLTGELPIGRFAPPSQKTDIDQRIDEVVLQALARERELRQRSAGEVKTQVEQIQSPTQAGSSAGLPTSAKPISTAAPPDSPIATPHWSRKAIVGAFLAAVGLLPPVLLLMVSILGRGGLGGLELSLMLGWVVCLGIPGTVLGWMALTEIRLSNGQLQGLPLAMFAACCLPALLLAALLAVPIHLMLDSLHVIYNPAGVLLMSVTISTLLSATIVVLLTGAGSRRPRQQAPPVLANPSKSNWVWPIVIVAVLLLFGFGAMLLLAIGFFTVRVESSRSAPPPPTIETAEATPQTPRVQAQFTLPAGQVATFENETRSNNLVASVPGLSAYLIAREREEASGTFRWAPGPGDPEGLNSPWQLELISPDGNRTAGSVDVPRAIAAAPGSISLWRKLEPDREFIEWAGQGDSGRPAIGLRIRTRAHGLQSGLSASATGTTNWVEAITRR
ncbi:MAG: serine/threonine-protein kinase [Verrucomicrobia bacterium]|nr:serine/threonine-protein kinase [Verrucomicrobiota bacterium]